MAVLSISQIQSCWRHNHSPSVNHIVGGCCSLGHCCLLLYLTWLDGKIGPCGQVSVHEDWTRQNMRYCILKGNCILYWWKFLYDSVLPIKPDSVWRCTSKLTHILLYCLFEHTTMCIMILRRIKGHKIVLRTWPARLSQSIHRPCALQTDHCWWWLIITECSQQPME